RAPRSPASASGRSATRPTEWFQSMTGVARGPARRRESGRPDDARPAMHFGKPARILFALAGLALGPMDARAADPAHAATARQMAVDQQRHGIAGEALLVMRDDQVLFRGADGFADVDTHDPMTPDHVFPVYSLAKLFVSTLVMQLVEQGAIDLDKPA